MEGNDELFRHVDKGKISREHLNHKTPDVDTSKANDKQVETCEECRSEISKRPWDFGKDVVREYLRMRADLREEYFAKLMDAERKKIDKERRRIAEARRNFEAFSPKHVLIQDLKSLREQWRPGVQHSERPRQPQEGKRGSASVSQEHLESRETTRPMSKQNRVESNMKFGDHFKVGVMYFRKAAGQSTWKGDKCPLIPDGSFPDQKTSVDDILSDEPAALKRNPLAEECPPDTLRYFHFPSNNMHWIEVAMARYYGEKPGNHDELKALSEMSKAERLLCREFWRGQVHGSVGQPVHARHMRPRCSVVPCPRVSTPSDGAQNEESASTKNVALFLPYLHWELHLKQKMIQRAVDDASQHIVLGKTPKVIKVFEDARTSVLGERKATWFHMNPQGDKEKKERLSILARLLWTVAQVASEMSYEADERFLRTYLHHSSPIHVRRTLDQYYFHTVKDTGMRDRDQVVHRETRAGKYSHAKNIKTRIVMVDQLWLWILDENTIVTSFPRRWGRNKQDSSGVHKSLRERLRTTIKEGVKSIHHLALIIVDQCSRVFFDRTKPLDLRPEVMDLFSSAIGNVTDLTAIAFEGFWRNMSLISHDISLDIGGKKQRWLDINPEGRLLIEAQDVSEELMIMLRVYGQQLTVMKDFRRYLVWLKADITRKALGAANVEDTILHKLDRLLGRHQHPPSCTCPSCGASHDQDPAIDSAAVTVQEADIQLELIENRQAEIRGLEDTTLRTCQQLEGLLSLKQQQASILEAKAAIRRADESVKQGRSIVAFTIITICFLPLGFFAAFFGMNNQEATGNSWMTLNRQVTYMFGLSAAVIFIAISLAFSSLAQILSRRVRLGLKFFATVLALGFEQTGLAGLWRVITPNENAMYERITVLSRRLYWIKHKKQAKDGGKGGPGPGRGEEAPADDKKGISRARTWWEGAGTPSLPNGGGARRASTAGFPRLARSKTTTTGAAFSHV